MYSNVSTNYGFAQHIYFKRQQTSSDETVRTMFLKLGDYRIDESIVFIVEPGEKSVSISCEQLDLYSIGSDYEEAKKDMIDEIDFAWSEYVIGDKSKLTYKAIEYGKMLRQYIRKV